LIKEGYEVFAASGGKAAKEMLGCGGGQPFFATTGGKDVGGLERAIEKALKLLIS